MSYFKMSLVLTASAVLFVAVPPSWVTCGRLQSSVSPEAHSKSQKQDVRRKVEFTEGNMGEIETADGLRLGFTNFRASDGVTLRVLYWDFDDDSGAKDAFEKEVNRAGKVLERGAKLDDAGKAIGTRARVLLTAGKPEQVLFGIIWTDGAKFHEIRSRSLRDALELEMVYEY
ncbi:MAG: hypothetical protein WAN14_21145 [Candidatus Acidiferrales bacterium]